MPFDSAVRQPSSRPFVKWTGGKTAELPSILERMPEFSGRLLEPFIGGGAVAMSMPPSIRVEGNDMSKDLVALYAAVTEMGTEFVEAVEAIDDAWSEIGRIVEWTPEAMERACRPMVSVFGPDVASEAARSAAARRGRKTAFIERLRTGGELEGDGAALLASAAKSGLYTAIRSFRNGSSGSADSRCAAFWFLREYCYGGMFRTNSSGGFNVPYGGMSYDSRSMRTRLEQAGLPSTRERLRNTRVVQGDFSGFLDLVQPTQDDFVFLDPPYDGRFSTYDGNAFGKSDHGRLAAWMAAAPCRWMMVVSSTPFVEETYAKMPGARVAYGGKTYMGSIKNRYERRAVHLTITNYGPQPSPNGI